MAYSWFSKSKSGCIVRANGIIEGDGRGAIKNKNKHKFIIQRPDGEVMAIVSFGRKDVKPNRLPRGPKQRNFALAHRRSRQYEIHEK